MSDFFNKDSSKAYEQIKDELYARWKSVENNIVLYIDRIDPEDSYYEGYLDRLDDEKTFLRNLIDKMERS